MEQSLQNFKGTTSSAEKLDSRKADQIRSTENRHPSDLNQQRGASDLDMSMFLLSGSMCCLLSLYNSTFYKFQPLVISVMVAFSSSLAAVINPQSIWFSRICRYCSVFSVLSAIIFFLLFCLQ